MGERPVERLVIRADGAARGNPGPAAAGAVLIDASGAGAQASGAAPVAVVARPLGIQTNNFAEYTAVVLALELATRMGAREVELILDSKLVVEQLAGRWKVRNAALSGLHARARDLLRQFDRWAIRHQPRAANHAADALANLALDDPAAAALAEQGMPIDLPAEPLAPLDRRYDRYRAGTGSAVLGAASAIFDHAGRILLVRHSYGRRNWELPGGGSLPGEAPDAAARRELEEETGLRLSGGVLSGVYFEPDSAGHGPLVHFVFRFPWTADLRPAARPPEIEDVGFWPLEGLPKPMSDFTERRIADALEKAVAYRVVGPRNWRE